MNPRIRRAAQRLRCEKEPDLTLHFGEPTQAIRFGDTPDGGSATTVDDEGNVVPLLARGDHKHEMPARPNGPSDLFADSGLYFNDLAKSSATQSGYIAYNDGGADFIFDSPRTFSNPLVDPGAWGWNAQSTDTTAPSGTNGFAGQFLTCGTFTANTNETTVGRVRFDRLRKFRTKGRLLVRSATDAEGDLATFARGNTVYVGGLVTSSNRVPDTATDGVYFLFNPGNSSSGLETWQAVCRTGGNETKVDTGVVIPYQPVSGRQRAGGQVMDIRYDPTVSAAVEFRIDGDLVASIATHVPVGKSFCGWGFWMRSLAASPTQTFEIYGIDFLSLNLARFA